MQDVIIIGAGPTGLCLARSLSLVGLKTCIIDKQPESALEQPIIDGRDIALTHFSQRMLCSLGIWKNIPEQEVSAISKARVFNGQSSYAMELSPPDSTTALGCIVPNYIIRAAAYKAAKEDANITFMDSVSLTGYESNSSCITVKLSDGKDLSAKLVVAADSRFSETRRYAGIAASMRDYGKSMIVCQMQHDHDHVGTAHECFYYDYTLAVLPLNGKRSSVIITLPQIEASPLMQLPVEAFSQWVSQKFQYRLGNMLLDSERYTYPLVGVYSERFVAERLALAGDAAVGMHPVTAHGFNFGLKSIHCLTHEISSALKTRRDIASPDVLARYERKHRRATRPLYLATNGIVGLYTNNSKPAKVVRTTLLHVANNLLPLKHRLMEGLTTTQNTSSFPTPLRALRHILKRAA